MANLALGFSLFLFWILYLFQFIPWLVKLIGFESRNYIDIGVIVTMWILVMLPLKRSRITIQVDWKYVVLAISNGWLVLTRAFHAYNDSLIGSKPVVGVEAIVTNSNDLSHVAERYLQSFYPLFFIALLVCTILIFMSSIKSIPQKQG
jgi:hypothetical protein